MMKENPRQQAAALNYTQGDDHAPRLVAKGQGVLAEKIIELAKEHGIPIKEDVQLVEVLSSLELNQEIPPDLYKAVAEILSFIYALNRKAGGAA